MLLICGFRNCGKFSLAGPAIRADTFGGITAPEPVCSCVINVVEPSLVEEARLNPFGQNSDLN